MKKIRGFVRVILIPVAILTTTGLAVSSARAATLRIVALPQTDDDQAIERAVAGWALKEGPGDIMMVFSARTRALLTTIAIPNDPSKARPERKLGFVAPGMEAIRKYFSHAPAAGVDGSIIDASAFLDEIGPVIADHTSDTVRVALIGAAWFTAPGALEQSSYKGSFPSDGLILGDSSHSPFGTQGRRDLGGVTVDYCVTTGPASFLTPEHRDRIERAWSLIIAERGGQLTTFSTDLKTCFDRFGEAKAPDAKTFSIDQIDAQVFAMYRATDVKPAILDAAPVKTAQPAPPPASARAEEAARFSQTARSTPPSTLTGPAWIGLQWEAPVDIDLYVRCSPRVPFLFFGNQRTIEGTHEFDFRGGTGSTFETVDLTQSCPDISRAQVFVNLYSGRVSTPITGIVAVQFDGGLYRATWTMPSLSGNGGRGLSPMADMGPPYWVKIDMAALLHLPAVPQRRAAR